MDQQTIGVVGLGLLGREIATAALAYGRTVVGYDIDARAVDDARRFIGEALTELAGLRPALAAQCSDWSDRYIEAGGLDAFADCGYVIESVVEDLAVKRNVFAQLEKIIDPGAIIASNTSSCPITQLQQGAAHPQRFVGMHWASPCYIRKFLEVIKGEQTSDAVFDATARLGEALGKQPGLVRQDIRGFVNNRLSYAMLREALALLEAGVADAATIDNVFRNGVGSWAAVAGPFRFMDMTGLEAYAAVMRDLFPELSNMATLPRTMQQLIDSGARGIANGRGFYEYKPGDAERWEKQWQRTSWKLAELLDEPTADW